VNHFFIGLFTTNPEDVAAVQNDRFMNVWDGTSQNPVVEHSEIPSDAVEHRQLFGGVAGHDVGVLVVPGLATDLAGEGRDVVGDKPSILVTAPSGGVFQGAATASPILSRLCSSRVL
jgi:hypothetical protein